MATTNSFHGVPQNKNKVTDASFNVDSLGKSDEVVGKPCYDQLPVCVSTAARAAGWGTKSTKF